MNETITEMDSTKHDRQTVHGQNRQYFVASYMAKKIPSTFRYETSMDDAYDQSHQNILLITSIHKLRQLFVY